MSDTVSLRTGQSSRAVAIAPLLFAVTVFASAALVFLVEPMMAKLVLPTLGGAASVWNTSLAFFQAALLLGYAYAHVLQKIGSVRLQTLIHGGVLLCAALVLPLKVSGVLGEPVPDHPIFWLLGVLTLSVGAPFAVLSATAPLVQAWYARVRAGHADAANPYVLYAASNLGSLLALLAYPILVEPMLRLRTQTLSWSLGYGVFIAMMAVVAVIAWRAGQVQVAEPEAADPAAPITWRDRLLWVLLAAAPSSLMLGVTTYISTDVASAPFLWVAPLALYLLTFIIAFQAKPLISRQNALLFQAAAFAACLITLRINIPIFLLQAALHLVGFFLTALVCHQALAARRPHPSKLTEFYLLMSLGGVIGGGFNAFVAPLIFKTVLEYPVVMVLAGLARPWGRGWLTRQQAMLCAAGVLAVAAAAIVGHFTGLSVPVRLLLAVMLVSAYLLRDRAPVFVGLCVAMVLCGVIVSPRQDVLLTDRSFFGVSRLIRIDVPGLGPTRLMSHGTTLHGAQAMENPVFRCRPLVYYGPTTPIGQVFRSVQARKPAISVGAIGMGAGSVAAYTRPGDSMRFFEIDPLVVRMSTNPANFSFIKGCAKGSVDWVLGDARLTLQREPDDKFDILLVDAFSSDSVPAHLLTVEAMRGYLRRIKPDGVIIMHLSNRNLALMEPVAAVAKAAGAAALQQAYASSPTSVRFVDTGVEAVIVARDQASLAPYLSDPRWKPAQSHGVRVWTDDYTNLFGALIRGIGHTERELRGG